VASVSAAHQYILKQAYEKLKKDPAFLSYQRFAADNHRRPFPTLDEIQAEEGATIVPAGGRGPDGPGNSRYSEHYYNPRLDDSYQGSVDVRRDRPKGDDFRGNAPGSVKRYFTELVARLNGAGSSGNAGAGHQAAYAAHYLADMYVPYHTVGLESAVLRELLFKLEEEYTIENRSKAIDKFIAGSYYPAIYGSEKMAVVKDALFGTIKTVTGDSVTAAKRRDLAAFLEAKDDWFAPWYYDGPVFGGPTGASHIIWEYMFTHKYENHAYTWTGTSIEKNTDEFRPTFENASVSRSVFGNPQLARSQQADQAALFAKRSAEKTRDAIDRLFDYPSDLKGINLIELQLNGAVRAVYTMFRASFSALQPIAAFERIATQPRYKVTASPASYAFLIARKADPRGIVMRMQPSSPCTTRDAQVREFSTIDVDVSWTVDASETRACKVLIEAIGTFTEPDLQYGWIEIELPRWVGEPSDPIKKEKDKPTTRKETPPLKTITVTGSFSDQQPAIEGSGKSDKGSLTVDPPSSSGTRLVAGKFDEYHANERGQGNDKSMFKFTGGRTIELEVQPGGTFTGSVSRFQCFDMFPSICSRSGFPVSGTADLASGAISGTGMNGGYSFRITAQVGNQLRDSTPPDSTTTGATPTPTPTPTPPNTPLAGGVIPPDSASNAPAAVSTFGQGLEGWGGGSFPDGGPYDRVIAAAPVQWQPGDGRSGNAISMADPGAGNFFFEAPAGFLGNKQALYGGELRYDFRSEGGALFDEADVILLSPGAVMIYQAPAKPSSAWTSVTVPLVESAWKVEKLAGRAPTQVEFQRALANVTALRIRGEYRNGPETAWLGNVALVPRSGPAPQPSPSQAPPTPPPAQPPRAQAPSAVTGNWQGTWRNSRGESGPWPINIVETNGVITGTDDGMKILDGKRVGDTMTWRMELDGGKRRWTVTVTISPDGQTMHVTYNGNDARGPYTGGGDVRRR